MTEKTYRDFVEITTLGRHHNLLCVIKLFEDTPLRKTELVKISDLEQLMKHSKNGLTTRPPLYYWKEDDDSKIFEYSKDSTPLTIQEMVENCESVRLWMKEYYPENVI